MSIEKLTFEERPAEPADRTGLPWQAIWFYAAVHNLFRDGASAAFTMHHITDTLPGAMVNSCPEAREETERIMAPLLAAFRDHMAKLMGPTAPSTDPNRKQVCSLQGIRVELPVLVSLP